MEIKLSVVNPQGKVLGELDNLVAMSEKFFMFKDKDGDLAINLTQYLKVDPKTTITQILQAERVIVTNKDGNPIFVGPPWNEAIIGDFLVKAGLIDTNGESNEFSI